MRAHFGVRFLAALQAFLLLATLTLPGLVAASEISTDLWVYNDGDTVTVTGVDFGAYETVDLVTTDPVGTVVDTGSAETDASGAFTYPFVLRVTEPGIYDVAATGRSSGLVASTQFDPPAAPTKLQYTDDRNLAAASVSLTWPDISGENCYYLYRSTSPIVGAGGNTTCSGALNGLAIARLSQNATGFTDSASAGTGFSAANDYYYAITAARTDGNTNQNGESPLSNEVTTKSINVTPTTKDFGTVNIGSTSAATTFTVKNDSGAQVRFQGVSFGGPNPGSFAASSLPALNAAIAAGAQFTFDVTFTPTAPITETAILRIDLNDAAQSGAGNFNRRELDVRGTGQAAVVDTDGDGIADGTDNCPSVSNASQANNDGDALGDACDADDDNDGVADGPDNCDFVSNAGQADTDGDSIGDACDADDDNDGVADGPDNCDLVTNSGQEDNDGDALGDACDPDDDDDTVADGGDNCPFVANASQTNTDGDALGDACDPDDDDDTVADGADNCPLTSNASQADADADNIGDACDNDIDGDGVDNGDDNCPLASNADQADNDADTLGDVCDPDDDNDTVSDGADNCQFVANAGQENNDADALGDACDPDDDNDGVADGPDNCDFMSNPGQENNDADALGDACDPDDDNDGVADGPDNCDFVANPSQANADGDGLGDACDPNAFAPDVETPAANATGDEGDVLSTGGAFVDADPSGTLTITKLSGAGNVTDNGDGTWSWQLPTADNGSGTTCVQADDAEHAVAVDCFDWSATNVEPTATLGNGGAVSEGSSGSVSFTGQFDPSSADTSAGFSYSYDFDNDGTFEIVASASSSATVPASYLADGPGSRTVRGRIADKDGGFTDYTTTITITNVDPSVTPAANQTADEGAAESFDLGTFSDPGVNDAPWAVSVDWGDGSPAGATSLGAPGTLGSLGHTYDDNGTYTVTVTVTDKDGGSDSATFDVVVDNVAPTATLDNDGPVDEGSSATVTFTGQSDPSNADTAAGFHYAFSCANGDLSGATFAASGATASTTCPFADDGTYPVKGRIIDKDGGYTEYSTDVVVTNVKPTPTITSISGAGGTACQAGNTVTLGFSWTDPAGANDHYEYDVNWGDGAHTTAANVTSPISGLTHTYAPGGPYLIVVTVNDEDPGSGGSASANASFSFLYATSGILQPINLTGTRSSFKVGSTIPVKLRVFDCNNVAVSGLTLTVGLVKVDSSASPTNETVPSSVPDVGVLMRYSGSPDNQYIYNLSTKRSQLCSTVAPCTAGGDLTAGSYRLTISGALIATQVAYIDARQ